MKNKGYDYFLSEIKRNADSVELRGNNSDYKVCSGVPKLEDNNKFLLKILSFRKHILGRSN